MTVSLASSIESSIILDIFIVPVDAPALIVKVPLASAVSYTHLTLPTKRIV